MVWNPSKRNAGGYDEPLDRLFSRNVEQLCHFARSGDGDVFHGINLRRIESITGRRKDISEVVCVTVDVDFKNTSQIEFESILNSFPHKPSVILNSGNGRHLYWFLKIPLNINSEAELERPEGISKGLAGIFKGDHTFNADRVLRTPGRINSKWDHRPMCEVITFTDTEYDLDDLKQYYVSTERPATEKLNIGSISSELPPRFVALLAKNRTIKTTWDGIRPDIDDQSGSGFDMSMASILVPYGFSPKEIAAILKQMPSGKGLEASGSYLEHTISKAIASIENDRQRPPRQFWPTIRSLETWTPGRSLKIFLKAY